mgnify:CR=1 FL=1
MTRSFARRCLPLSLSLGLVAAAALALPSASAQGIQRDAAIISEQVASRVDAYLYKAGTRSRLEFRGTTLAARAIGTAKVSAESNRTDVEADFKALPQPGSLGPYTVYVLWAITPEGRASALGVLELSKSGKAEIEDYLVEVSQRSAHLMRPNFFVNTPDILHASLQYGGPAMFKIRAVLAATGSPSWGVYAGYELYEHVAVKPGSEEYLDSEKYQIRVRDWEGAAESGRTLAPYLTQLNEIRRRHPALQLLRNLELHSADDDHTIVFSKRATSADGGSDTVIVVLNLDPHATRATTVHLNLPALGLDWQDRFLVHDELTGQQWTWGEHNYVQLDPGQEVAHILSVRRF